MKVEEEQIVFYYWTGVAVTFWAEVETGALDIVLACTLAHQELTMYQAFYAIENFRSKLAFVDALVEAKTSNKKLIERWSVLMAACNRLASRRNQVAHRRGFKFRGGVPGRQYGLIDWANFRTKDGLSTKPPPGALCTRDLFQLARDLVQLADQLRGFAYALRGEPEPRREFDEPQPNPPTMRALGNRIRAALGVPPKPSRRKPQPR